MLTKIIFCFVTFQLAAAQLNGEFWWLNSKLVELKHVEPPRPKFEDISEFDTDETAKIVFKDNDLHETENSESYPDTTTEENKSSDAVIYFKDDSVLTSHSNTRNSERPEQDEVQNNAKDTIKEHDNDIKSHNEDLFNFIFPDDADIIKHKTKTLNAVNSTRQTYKNNIISNEKILFDTEKEKFLSVNICTYMKEIECYRCEGVPYKFGEISKSPKNSIDTENVCCIIPLNNKRSSKISFPDSYDRLKRSANEQDISLALKQRNALMQRKYGTLASNTQTPVMPMISQKIVTPENDYIDPYWNIKGSDLKRPNKQEYMADSSHQEYEDYYAEELPKPGLVGLYSEHRPSSWSFINAHRGFSYNNEDNSEEVGVTGYSTIDPRHGHFATTSKLKRRFLKLKTNPEDIVRPETQTVTYQSNPDFQVLQGFKLPTLKTKSTSRPIRNIRRTTTTERNPKKSTVKSYYESVDRDYDDYIDIKQEIYKYCGRTKNENLVNHNCDRELGESPRGAHPWLVLAVLTKSRQSILCYATLIHPLAAITAADCTYGIAPGEITIIAGMWDLENDNRTQLQHRLGSVYVHQQYLPGKITYNLALLNINCVGVYQIIAVHQLILTSVDQFQYWRRPLRLDATVHPACVSDAFSGEKCTFVGWGGYDQAIYQRPHWQHTSILSPRDCEQRISTNQEFDLPIDAFCATVNSKTTVTGLGGPLICKSENIYSVAGFAIWRDEVIVLMQIQEWTVRAMRTLGIN